MAKWGNDSEEGNPGAVIVYIAIMLIIWAFVVCGGGALGIHWLVQLVH